MALDLSGLPQDEAFKKAAEFSGVPDTVLRSMWAVESSNGANLRSPAGAEGHFQTMPATRKTWEERTGRSFNPDDFNDSLTLAALTMQENMAHFNGNISDALRGYNAGWDRDKWNNDETLAYAGKVLGNEDTSAFAVRNSGREAHPLTVDEAWNTSAFDIRNHVDDQTSGAKPKEYLSDIEKGVRADAAMNAAVAAVLSGTDPEAAANAARDLPTRPLVEEHAGVAAATPGMEFDNTESWEQDRQREQAFVEEQKRIDSLTFGDKLEAAWMNSATTAMVRILMDEGPSPRPDASFDIMDKEVQDKIFAFAQNEDDIEAQMEARSQGELGVIQSRLRQERADQGTIAAGSGAWAQSGYNLLAGVIDPVGWAAGLGVSKGFQLAGWGSRAALLAGNNARAFAFAAGEGAAGNVAVTALVDAAGSHQTTNDYAFSFGTGLFFGAAFNVPEWYGASREFAAEELRVMGEQIRDHAVQQDAALYNEALGNLGPKATPEQIKAEVTRIEAERQDRVMQAVLGNADDVEQILPRMSPEAREQFRTQFADDTSTMPQNMPGALLTTQADFDRIVQKYHLDATISDNAERRLAAEQYARAERFLAENPVDKERAKTLLAAGGMESTAARMLMSDNPLMQMAASVLLESSSGAQGGSRRVTAAITAKVRERVYIGNTLRQYENTYGAWRNARGGSALSDFIDNGKQRKQFDILVYEERDRRFQGKPETSDPAIKRAADMLDEVYERMRKDQKFAGTLGSTRLSDESVRGFTPRKWAAGTVRAMDPTMFRVFQKSIQKQFVEISGYDQKFAEKFAKEYTTRIRKNATGSYDVPALLHDDDAADTIRDVLKSMGLAEVDAKDLLGKFGRGGAGHTKKRIDLDLTQEFELEDGKKYRLLDYIDVDNMSLLRNYARRTAGEVALAKYGIMGEPGLKELKLAIEAGIGKDAISVKSVEAFEQVAAEFLGKPFGKNLGKWADNARIATSAIRLGGMGFTQLGEATNGAAALGWASVARSIKSIPRLVKETRRLANGEKVDGLLSSIELYTGELGVDGYKMQGLYDVNDGFEVYGKETLDRFSKAVRLSNHGVRVLSLHRSINAVQVRGMSEQIVLKALRYIRAGGEDAALADMGITPALQAALKKDLKNIAQFDGDRVVGLDLTKAEDQIAANAFAQSVQRGAAQIIQDTFIGETGKWAHNDFLKFLTQFRTFSLVSVEKQWGRQLSVHGGAKMLGYTLGAMSIASVIHMARVQAKALGMSAEDRERYLDRNLSPLAFGRATMNYVSSLGLLPDLIDVPLSVVGQGMAGRSGAQSGFIGGSIAPAAGVVNDAVEAAREVDPHKALRVMPGASIPQFAWMMNALDQ